MIDDGFETQVYCAEEIRLYITIDQHAIPIIGDLVAVARLAADKLKVQRYRGQSNLGVVRVLKDYTRSKTGTARTINVHRPNTPQPTAGQSE